MSYHIEIKLIYRQYQSDGVVRDAKYSPNWKQLRDIEKTMLNAINTSIITLCTDVRFDTLTKARLVCTADVSCTEKISLRKVITEKLSCAMTYCDLPGDRYAKFAVV